ncbi:aromatic prenyltransferase [Nocardia sp. NPDC051570]|uniref:aromatic prenyltransferase n=1 Tax=Nocardia sp. NPDC051570 TaxID=3364324 RepID=UPI0037AF6AE6
MAIRLWPWKIEVKMSASAGVTLDRLRVDLQQYARLAEVPYDSLIVDRVLDVLAEEWASSAIAVRTTTQPLPERDVNVRLTNAGDPAALLSRLRDAGLVTFTGHPMEQLLSEVSAAVPAVAAVDVAIGTGIQKVWLIFPELVSVDRMLAFGGMPEAARGHEAHLARYGGEFAIMAVDFVSHTMNLYSRILAPGELTAADITAILADLDFVAPTEEELSLLGNTFNVYRTFSWTSPRMQRICFPYRCDAATFPRHLDPLLDRFVTGAPFPAPGPHGFVFYAAYGQTDRYYKVQAEYAIAPNSLLPGGTTPHVHRQVD